MIRWKPAYAIGVPEIDDQHQSLFEYAGRVEDAVQAGHFDYRVGEIYGFLSTFMARHFDAEERIMRESDYPGLEAHVREHAEFRRRLAALEPQWDAEGSDPALVIALLGLVDLWLTEHILSRDLEIAAHLKAHAPGSTRE